MSIEYMFEDGSKYGFSYSSAKEEYHRFKSMDDETFFAPDNFIEALHFACFISFIKELPNACTLSDKGIIHQMVHILHLKSDVCIQGERETIRERFNSLLELS